MRKAAGMSVRGPHPSERTILDVVLGGEGEAAAQARQHIERCMTCSAKYVALRRALKQYAAGHGLVCGGPGAKGTCRDRAFEQPAAGPKEVPLQAREAIDVTQKSEQPVHYALRQEHFEWDEKVCLARCAVAKATLRDGDGVVLDAGSTCKAVWEEFMDDIQTNGTVLSFCTNSFQVWQSWERTREPTILQTPVELLGNSFDRSHQAFFGGNARQLLDPGHFRPSAVFIGTSGIQFDVNEGILFTYHAGERERDFKQLLFQCPATKSRFILATAPKVGIVGPHSFNVLGITDWDTKVPLVLVTTAPKRPAEAGFSDEAQYNRECEKFLEVERLFEQAVKTFKSDAMKVKIQKSQPGAEIRWIIIDPSTGEEVDSHVISRIETTNATLRAP